MIVKLFILQKIAKIICNNCKEEASASHNSLALSPHLAPSVQQEVTQKVKSYYEKIICNVGTLAYSFSF